MVKLPTNTENISLNVFLKNGEIYVGKDITNQPLGEHDRVVSFWRDENTVVTYPLEQVERFEFVFGS